MKTMLSRIKTRAPFSTLFPIDPHVLEAITESMTAGGFDDSKPIAVWEGIVIDGHTRLRAAAAAGLPEVAIYVHPFATEDEALEYAISSQRDRRNITDGDLLRCIEALDKRKRQGERTDLARDQAKSGKSIEHTANILGIGRDKAERARTVIDHAPEPTKQAVLAGEKSINAAYRETQERRRFERENAPEEAPAPLFTAPAPGLETRSGERRPIDPKGPFSVEDWAALTETDRRQIIEVAPLTSKATFNRTNDNVEWALWTWNPVTGCLHNCDYCYARDIANRFYPQLFVPSFLPERLHAPRRMKVPAAAATNIGEKNVFTCSMADLFGKWVPQEWIDSVFEQVKQSPEWNFLFLTKFPQRLAELRWPENAWVGTTVDRQYRVGIAEKSFRGVEAGVKWLSCEPLLERLTFTSLEMFDWVVIGGSSRSSQTPEFQPPWEWVEHLMKQARDAGCKVYLKPNLTVRPREYPGEMVTS